MKVTKRKPVSAHQHRHVPQDDQQKATSAFDFHQRRNLRMGHDRLHPQTELQIIQTAGQLRLPQTRQQFGRQL